MSSVDAQEATTPQQQPLTMQIIINKDLIGAEGSGWGMGPLIAQGAHAALAVITQSSSSPSTQAYLAPDNLASMHKVVLQSPSSKNPDTTSTSLLRDLSEKLQQARLAWEQARQEGTEGEGTEEFPMHYLWIEDPEGFPTALAVAPNRKPPALKRILNKCSLLRA